MDQETMALEEWYPDKYLSFLNQTIYDIWELYSLEMPMPVAQHVFLEK